MYSRVSTGILHGIEGICVMVEADISDGLPVFDMVGALGSEVKEGRERVRTALKNCGFVFPAKRITINITPAGIKKTGAGFDLPIAVSLLAAQGVITDPRPGDVMIIGEMGLDGTIHPVEGILPMVSGGMDAGRHTCIVSRENYHEACLVPGIEVIPVAGITDVIAYLNDGTQPDRTDIRALDNVIEEENDFDFSDVNGQSFVKRACEIAAAGMHNLLLMGPPGAGKTFAARCIPSILPPMTKKEQIELSKIYSVCGLFGERERLLEKRPFRSPHHTISTAGLVGGGGGSGQGSIRPGEISLASSGVLFLDELPEFRPSTLEILRQPLEDRVVSISRVSGDYTFPADFILVAAMNPC
ncbi:MAG: YifB family Mg chelatase-like AAA ATPase, partial [Lachnospiraceae bacterium]|nr:YifB family Mg chelatase-like AAA ATPase [Lachnospiraceae bacterium]